MIFPEICRKCGVMHGKFVCPKSVDTPAEEEPIQRKYTPPQDCRTRNVPEPEPEDEELEFDRDDEPREDLDFGFETITKPSFFSKIKKIFSKLLDWWNSLDNVQTEVEVFSNSRAVNLQAGRFAYWDKEARKVIRPLGSSACQRDR
jgi:hypothetical protein